MYFTDEEKEIMKKIALKDRYNVNDFLMDNFSDEDISRFIPLNEQHKLEINQFIYIWKLLLTIGFAIELRIPNTKIRNNLKLFFKDVNEEIAFSNNIQFDYESFICNELLIFQQNLKDFINDGFKTKEEIEQEKEIQARNQALADSRDSVKIARKSLYWTIGVAVVSGLISIISLGFTIKSYNKETEVKVKNLNEINTQQLESQLKQTNQELKDIKIKFEELQKQSQISTKK